MMLYVSIVKKRREIICGGKYLNVKHELTWQRGVRDRIFPLFSKLSMLAFQMKYTCHLRILLNKE